MKIVAKRVVSTSACRSWEIRAPANRIGNRCAVSDSTPRAAIGKKCRQNASLTTL
jgi:hypothetical protein